jgi:Beta-propeller repeat
VDAQGNVLVAATSYPPQRFPPSNLLTTGGNALIRKLSPDGSALVYSVSLVLNTQASGVAVDSSGNALIVGTSYTTAFPTTGNAIQPQTLIKSMFVTNHAGKWNRGSNQRF